MKRITDLEAAECRYPVGNDGQHLFCGAHTDKPPYCPAHRALAYTPTKQPTLGYARKLRTDATVDMAEASLGGMQAMPVDTYIKVRDHNPMWLQRGRIRRQAE